MLYKEIEDLFRENITPKSIYAVYDCHVNSEVVTLGAMSVKSESLVRHLKGCNRAVLLADTLGTNADMLIRRYSVQDMEKALIAQNICARMIETYLDETEKEISTLEDLKGLFAIHRYSPGYGDFSITCQKDILKLLGASRIGLSLTDGFMLAPSKSVTAVIGFSDDKVGNDYKNGIIFLPQLLMSAEAAKSAFEEIKLFMAKRGKVQEKRGKIALLTVKGDIHDIGKNIVKVLLENYNFDVVDLGRNVEPSAVAQTVLKENINLVGLSALMTTTAVYMEETIRLLKEIKPECRIMVGGAVLNKEYTDKIGADYYANDAMSGVRYADDYFK